MSLLPYRYPLKEQKFASFIDVNGMCGYEELDTNPMTCKASLLEHIAMGHDVSIEGMLEREARVYLANVENVYNHKGTIESALQTLASIGLHSEAYPAEIIEYRDMAERRYREFHDGTSLQDGMALHNGGLPTDVFRLWAWYQIAIIISAPASSRQISIADRLLKEVIPVRCEIVGFINKLSDLHDGASFQDGTRNHGLWRFE